MASITGTSASSSPSSAAAALSNQLSSVDGLANENTFLKLLVAQLKNQDPLQPQDGTQFVSQLAQFSDLEQNLAMRSDLDAIKAKYTASSTSGNSSNSSAV